jgi:hypothetical protein
VPVVIALVPSPSPPEAAGMAYGGMLGEGWSVHGFRETDGPALPFIAQMFAPDIG